MLDTGSVLRRLAAVLVPAFGILLVSFALPRAALDGRLAVIAYWIAESGDTYGLPLLALGLLLLLVGRPGLQMQRRGRETVLLLAVAGLHLGGGAYLNEFGVKPWFGIARPNIQEMAQSGVLRIAALDFYALGEKTQRTAHLERILAAEGFAGPPMDARVRQHWTHMTGYSFPSGHSFSSLLATTFFLAMGVTFLPRRRLWPFYAMVPWALAVCYSRLILQVHSPLDICVGALQGMLVGLAAYLLARALLESGDPHIVRPT